MVEHPVCKDVAKVLKEFSSLGTADFEEFQKIWTEHKFYFMHCICRDAIRRCYFLELMIYTATESASNDTLELPERIGAVYMWYGLFLTQPQQASNLVKIRLSLQDWYAIEGLHITLRDSKYYDADFVLCRLKSLSAFHVCAHRQKLCLGQQSETLNKHLSVLGNQSLVSSESDVMKKLLQCQESLGSYSQIKEILTDHLPPHLVTDGSGFDSLLSQERLDQLKAPPIDEGEENEEGGTESQRQESDSQRQSEETEKECILRKAYESDPNLTSKRRSKKRKGGN